MRTVSLVVAILSGLAVQPPCAADSLSLPGSFPTYSFSGVNGDGEEVSGKRSYSSYEVSEPGEDDLLNRLYKYRQTSESEPNEVGSTEQEQVVGTKRKKKNRTSRKRKKKKRPKTLTSLLDSDEISGGNAGSNSTQISLETSPTEEKEVTGDLAGDMGKEIKEQFDDLQAEVRGDMDSAPAGSQDNEEAASKHHGGHKKVKGGGKKHGKEAYKKKGKKKKKDYKEKHAYKKKTKGHHDKVAHKKKYKDEKGKKLKHEEGASHFGEHKKSEKGKKGAKYDEEGHHKKGHTTKGEHNVHKKDEYHKKHEFYDEHHDGAGHHKSHGHHKGHHQGHGKKYKSHDLKDKKHAHSHHDHHGGHSEQRAQRQKLGQYGGRHSGDKWGFVKKGQRAGGGEGGRRRGPTISR